MTLLVIGVLLGVAAGLRSMAPVAVVAWAAQLWWPEVQQSSLRLMATPATAWIFTLFGAGELVFDKLPSTPSRLAAGPLGARILMGALCAATACAAAHQSLAVGAVAGAIGGVAGAFGGYHVRRHVTTNVKAPDLPVAIAEDILAIGLAALAASLVL